MADPLSILAGVVGILSSLSALGTQFNMLRHDAAGANAEMRELTDEVTSLTLVLSNLKVAIDKGAIESSLEHAFGGLLQRMGETVTETRVFAERCRKKKRTAGIYWAFSGKAQCTQLCRRLESYKATVNLILTTSSLLRAHESSGGGGDGSGGRDDRVYQGIEYIRRNRPCGQDDLVLQRFLTDVETIYEGSSLAGLNDVTETDALARTPLPSVAEDNGQDNADQAASESSASPRDSQDLLKHLDSSTQHSPTVADEWRKVKAQPSHVLQLYVDHPDIDTDGMSFPVTASRGGRFAVCFNEADKSSYGIIHSGFIDQPETWSVLNLDDETFDPPDHSKFSIRRVLFLGFRADGALLAGLLCSRKKSAKTYKSLVMWASVDSSSFEVVLSISNEKPDTSLQFTVSRDCRYVACSETRSTIVIYDITNGAAEMARIEHQNARFVKIDDAIWTSDAEYLLIVLDLEHPPELEVSVYVPVSGDCVGKFDMSALSALGPAFDDVQFFPLRFSGAVVVHPLLLSIHDRRATYCSVSDEQWHLASQSTAVQTIVAQVDIRFCQDALKQLYPDRVLNIDGYEFSSDGSCIIVQYSTGLSRRSRSSKQHLVLIDTRTLKRMLRIPCSSEDQHFSFDYDSGMILVGEYLPQIKTYSLSFWEPATET